MENYSIFVEKIRDINYQHFENDKGCLKSPNSYCMTHHIVQNFPLKSTGGFAQRDVSPCTYLIQGTECTAQAELTTPKRKLKRI